MRSLEKTILIYIYVLVYTLRLSIQVLNCLKTRDKIFEIRQTAKNS